MKRAHDAALATSAATTRGSDANAPWPKRMATEVTATIATSSRYGFGFRGSFSAKGTSAAAIGDNNQSEGSDSAAVASTNATTNKEESPEIPTTTTTTTTTTKVPDVVEANESTRGRGRLTARERSLTRPNVRKASVGATSGLPIPAPRSTSRLVLKQEPTIGMGTRRASVTVPSIQSSSLVRRASEQSPLRLKRDVDGGKENSDPVANSAERAIEAFDAFLAATMTSERDVEAETLLQARLKAKKFDMKARCEEMQNTVRQAKVVVRAMLDDRTAVRTQWSTACTKTLAELRAEEQRRKRLQAQMTEKTLQLSRVDQEMESLRRLTDGADTRVRDLTEQNKHHVETQEHLKRVRAELEAANQRLQAQLQQAQKQNDELTLELRSYQTTMSDRVQLYEEKKKELEQFYQRKETEEEKRKSSENEHLHARLIELKEEMASANQEKETYRQRFFSAEEETRRERDRSAQIEREKCTIEAQYRSLEDRLGQSSTEMSQMKAKIDQKEQEISGLVQSLTEIQKLNAVSSSKIDTEKKELTEKIDQLQSQLRDAERNEATNTALMRELRGQAEAYASAKTGWDEKQREYESRIKEVEAQLQTSARDLSVETGVRQMLESQNRELRNETTAVNAQTEALRFEMKRLSSKHEEAKVAWQAQLASAEERLDTEKAVLQRQIDVLHEEKVSIESEVKTLRERAANVRDGDFEELCNVKREAEVLRLRLQEMSNHGFQSMAQKDRLIEELQEKIRQGEKTRRMLHNTIQELRGNVRVFARTRPFLPSDGAMDTESLTPAVSCEFDGQTVKLRRQGKGSSSNEQDTHSFSFDKVFAPSSGQDNIFEEVSEFVQSAIDGYHVCLFSYGQTGSGKTHTMQGSGNGQMRGIIPRSIEKVLAECTLLKDHGWSYTMKVSFLEIYNETLKDLLVTKEDANKVLSIKKDAKGGVCVPDLTLVEVTEMQQVEKLMERASRARSVACTEMNAQSSRSHSVFTLHLQGVNDSEGIMLDGQLNLVDLAGSERASRSGVSGERLKETQAINKSLSCLADVFTAIGNKSAHIPFRNSKLTYLLQTSLSGDGKTLMMVNVSPTLESAGETLCSLRFAQQVNKCELGKPKRQIKSKKDA